MHVRLFKALSRLSRITFSLTLSNAEVASSKISTSADFKYALAIPILCLCPPEMFCPPIVNSVFKPLSISAITLSNAEYLQLFTTFFSLTLDPIRRLFIIVPSKRTIF